MLLLDSGALSRLAQRTRRAAALMIELREQGLWPPIVPTIVLAECISGRPRTDTSVNRLLKSCDVEPLLPEFTARRAGQLRARARRGSIPDAVVVALAEPHGTVLTTDDADFTALAEHADDVVIEVV